MWTHRIIVARNTIPLIYNVAHGMNATLTVPSKMERYILQVSCGDEFGDWSVDFLRALLRVKICFNKTR